jgi:hypothetical protein
MMSPELGQRVIAIAQGLVGSHYINGGYGATPGRNDGCPCRAGGIELIADENHLEPKPNSANKKANLAVNAATMTIKTYCVCAGNYATFPGGRETTATAPDLIAYLDSLKGTPPSNWQNYYVDFTPRRTFGPGQNGGDGGGKLVWASRARASATSTASASSVTAIGKRAALSCSLTSVRGARRAAAGRSSTSRPASGRPR